MSQKISTSFAFTVIVILAGFLGVVIIGINRQPLIESDAPIVSSKPSAGKSQDTPFPKNWKTYKNEQYGFEMQFPAEYQLIQDKSGWPHAIALISMPNSQSYALPIEIWENETALKLGMQSESRSTDMGQVTVKKLPNGKLITLLNQNDDEEVAQIIKTFQLKK